MMIIYEEFHKKILNKIKKPKNSHRQISINQHQQLQLSTMQQKLNIQIPTAFKF